MNQTMRTVLAVVIGIAVYYGVVHFRTPADQTAQAKQELDRIRTEADKRHPEMARTDAMKAVFAEDSAKAMAGMDDAHRSALAANAFWGFYYVNTRERVAYCKQRGVDISSFVDAFAQVHAAEFARADAIYRGAGVDPETVWPIIQPELAKVIEQDMKDFTAGANVPLEQACTLLNANARKVAEYIALPPHIKQGLMKQ